MVTWFSIITGETTRKRRNFFDMLGILPEWSHPTVLSSMPRLFQDIGRIQSRTKSRHQRSWWYGAHWRSEDDLSIFSSMIQTILFMRFKVTTEACPRNDIHQIKLQHASSWPRGSITTSTSRAQAPRLLRHQDPQPRQIVFVLLVKIWIIREISDPYRWLVLNSARNALALSNSE